MADTVTELPPIDPRQLADVFGISIAGRTVMMEARNQGEAGMRAVAAVLINRMKDRRFGNRLAAVCLWPAQFSCWNTLDKNRIWMAEQPQSEFTQAEQYVIDALQPDAPDPTNGSTHYFNPKEATIPAWARLSRQECKIGDHLFYSHVP